jgi:integrase
MASVNNRPNGHKWVQFTDLNRKRHTIRLGKKSKKQAEEFANKVELLLEAKALGSRLENELLRWLRELALESRVLFEKLVDLKLAPPQDVAPAAKLEAFIAQYVADRTDAKPATKEVWRQGERGLIAQLGASAELASVSPGDADRFKTALVGTIGKNGKKLSPMTVRKRLQFATMIFRAAVRQRLITVNPFAGIGIKANKSGKKQFITIDQTQAILNECPDHHWRMIVTLTRYGGLRCPSEVLSLRWSDINWEKSLITVRSPKTEHHAGKESRVIPLWPQLRKALDESYFEAEKDGAVYVVDERFRKAAIGKDGWRNINLRTTFEKIIARAGVPKYPRLFHSLRSSRQTELSDSLPQHVVCALLGNSEDVARDHYLLTTDEHLQRSMAIEAARVKEGDVKADARKRQQLQESRRNLRRPEPELAGIAGNATEKPDGEGFEPPVPFRVQRFSRPPQ